MQGRRRFQAGQALVLSLALAIIASAALFAMFGTGRALHYKTRLVNAADAAAHGAAVWRARVLNFNAYSNRAIIAQDVAVAQAITLKSWSRYFTQFALNGARLSRVYPPVSAVFEGLYTVARQARTLAERAAQVESRARAAQAIGYKDILQASQELLTLSATGFGMSAVANEIARANHPRAFAFALPDGGAFRRLTRRYDSDEDRERMRDLVVRSLDRFTGGPRSTDLVLWGVPASCVLSLGRPADWFQMYRKRGGTQLAPGLDRWEAADTGSMHDSARTGFFSRRCRRFEWLPLGWGAAELALGEPLGRLVSDPGGVSANPAASDFAQQALASEAREGEAGGYAGISRVRELAYDNFTDTRYPRSRVSVLARIDANAMLRNPALQRPIGRLRAPGGEVGARHWALASAEVYFSRPTLHDGHAEYASLYSPYWQVRLVAPSASERAMAESYVH